MAEDGTEFENGISTEEESILLEFQVCSHCLYCKFVVVLLDILAFYNFVSFLIFNLKYIT